MKKLIISFENEYFSDELTNLVKAKKMLSQRAIFVENVIIFTPSQKNEFLSAMESTEYQAVFIVNAELAEFSVIDCLRQLNFNLNDEGFCSNNRFIALLKNSFSDEYAELLDNAYSSFINKFHQKAIFKLFGVEKKKIEGVTDEITKKYPQAVFRTQTIDLDSRTYLIYDSDASKIEIDKAIKEFVLTFKSAIYAEDDYSLEQRFYDLLKLRRVKVATAESMTGGKIASKIVSVNGASDVFFEGLVTYNTASKENRLNVDKLTHQNYGVVSSQVAFEMAKSLLENPVVSCAISITGYAGGLDACENDGLVYIGIGYENSIQVYKYVFSGTRKERISRATNTALFLAIKTISNAN